MKKIAVAVALLGVASSNAMEAHNIENGLIGLRRKVTLRLLDVIGRSGSYANNATNNKKIGAIIGICSLETYGLKNQGYFLRSRGNAFSPDELAKYFYHALSIDYMIKNKRLSEAKDILTNRSHVPNNNPARDHECNQMLRSIPGIRKVALPTTNTTADRIEKYVDPDGTPAVDDE